MQSKMQLMFVSAMEAFLLLPRRQTHTCGQPERGSGCTGKADFPSLLHWDQGPPLFPFYRCLAFDSV